MIRKGQAKIQIKKIGSNGCTYSTGVSLGQGFRRTVENQPTSRSRATTNFQIISNEGTFNYECLYIIHSIK